MTQTDSFHMTGSLHLSDHWSLTRGQLDTWQCDNAGLVTRRRKKALKSAQKNVTGSHGQTLNGHCPHHFLYADNDRNKIFDCFRHVHCTYHLFGVFFISSSSCVWENCNQGAWDQWLAEYRQSGYSSRVRVVIFFLCTRVELGSKMLLGSRVE